MTHRLSVVLGVDSTTNFAFDSGPSFSGYSGAFNIYASDGVDLLLSVTTSPTANGSKITFSSANIELDLKAADLAALPAPPADIGVRVLYFDFQITSPVPATWTVNTGHFIIFSDGATTQSVTPTIEVEIASTSYDVTFDLLNLEALPDDAIITRISPRSYGAVCDGETDDTEAVRDAAAAAEVLNVLLDFRGIAALALQADGAIGLNSDVEFGGLKPTPLNAIATPPTNGGVMTMFLIEDIECPLTEATYNISLSGGDNEQGAWKLNAGSRYPTYGIYDGPCYVKLESSYQVPKRGLDGTANFIQPFHVSKGGQCAEPLSYDISAYPNGVVLSKRDVSERRITISGLVGDASEFNNQCLLRIERCNVHVRDITVVIGPDETEPESINKIIYVVDASLITIEDYVTMAFDAYGTVGTYALELAGAAEVDIVRMTGQNGWGVIGNNTINGVRLTDSNVNRFDFHDSGHNVDIENTVFHDIGITVGYGGGRLRAANCTFHKANGILLRSDFGGYFLGAVWEIVNATFDNIISQGLNVVNCDTDGTFGSPDIDIWMPRVIRVSGVTRAFPATTSPAKIYPVRLIVNDASGYEAKKVFAPSEIVIDGVSCEQDWQMVNFVDIANCDHDPLGRNRMALTISNCAPTVRSPDPFADGTVTILAKQAARTIAAPVGLNLIQQDMTVRYFNGQAPAIPADPAPNVPLRNYVVGAAWLLSDTTGKDNDWRGICWSADLGLFCAISDTGTGNRVMTSPDGVTWTTQTSAADNSWRGVAWSPDLGLFCAVAITGSGNRVMTSPDGITWTSRTSAEDNNWVSVTWSPELGLFCAVATSGTHRVMTSPDGITWTARSAAASNGWTGICWSPELGMFCAVGNSGTGNRVMTSTDGITWSTRTSAADNAWTSVSWSPQLGLFCAVSSDGTNCSMTSPDGVTWTLGSATDKNWCSVTWSPELGLFCALSFNVSGGSTDTLLMTSPDGANWTQSSVRNNAWRGVCWCPQLGLFAGVSSSGTANRAMTSVSMYTYPYRS